MTPSKLEKAELSSAYQIELSRYGCVVVVNMKIRESREVVCCVRRIKRARNDTCIYGVTATPTLQFTSSFYLLICQFLCSYFLLPAL